MKTMILADGPGPTTGRGTSRGSAAWLLGLAVAALTSGVPCLAVDILFYEDFQNVSEWQGPGGGGAQYGSWRVTGGQESQGIMRFDRPEPTKPDGVPGWHAGWVPPRVFNLGTHTLEIRVDLVSANQNGAFTFLGANRSGALAGYYLGRDQNEIFLSKFGDQSGWYIAYYFAQSLVLTNPHTALSLAFSCRGTDLEIRTRILDLDNANAVLWEKTVTDTAAVDPTLPDRAWKGLTMDPEGYGPPVMGEVEALLAVAYLNTQVAPTQPSEVTVDNFMVLRYPAPALDYDPSVLRLSWPEDTLEEPIVVGASSLASNAVWTPWPEPIVKRFGELSMTVPVTNSQQFYRLVPGTESTDDFSPAPQWPYATKGAWVPYFYSPADPFRFEVTNVNSALWIRTVRPAEDGRVVILPPGPDVVVRDFYASVDIVDWPVQGPNGTGFGIGSRVWRDPDNPFPGNSVGYIGGVRREANGTNHYSIGMSGIASDSEFTYDPAADYRLVFSAAGSHLSLRLYNLTTGNMVAEEITGTDTQWKQGLVCFWVNAGPGGSCDLTLDNFFVTGTKP